MDSLPPHVEGFSHGISTTCLDNTASNDIPCSSDVRRTNHTGSLHELEHSESEAAQIEPSDIGMPAERNSMQAKPVEEAQRADEGRNDEVRLLPTSSVISLSLMNPKRSKLHPRSASGLRLRTIARQDRRWKESKEILMKMRVLAF